MNINNFFLSIFFGLMVIFFLFKPLDLKQQTFVDVPLFELKQFTLHEINAFGLTTLMTGNQATKYSNRYVVENMDYTDNSKKYIANMKAEHGVYKDDIIDLDGSIVYVREDGLTFETEKAEYNKKTNIVSTDTKYRAFRGVSIATGDSLKYYNILDKIESTNVVVNYKLGEKI